MLERSPRDFLVQDCSGLPAIYTTGRPIPTHERAGRAFQLTVKRWLDVLLALVGLIAFSPVMLILAVAIKASGPGPIIFRQMREGLNCRQFEILKFRTMYVDRSDPSGVAQTKSGDDRVTPIGAFMRRTSFDELPQLFNILRGDMSVVGPRPHVRDQQAAHRPYREVIPYYDLRYSMRPGLTGWAQANGLRGATTELNLARARIDYDIAYIQNFSLWLDIVIILTTLRREFLNGSGY
jgi:polysaccharide biosynthesis protein PslA